MHSTQNYVAYDAYENTHTRSSLERIHFKLSTFNYQIVFFTDTGDEQGDINQVDNTTDSNSSL